MEDKFECSMCGNCCKTIGKADPDKLTEWDKKLMKEAELIEEKKGGVNTYPLVSIYPEGTEGLYLFEWEYKRIKRIAEEKGIKIKLIPSWAVYDLKSNKTLISNWCLEGEICPFLEDNKCSIYKNRPIECKRYPLRIFLDAENRLRSEFRDCQNSGSEKFLPDNKEEGIFEGNSFTKYLKKMNDYYGEVFLYACQQYKNKEYTHGTVKAMIQHNVIKAAVGYPMKFLLKRIENSEKVSIFDFLIEKGRLPKEMYKNNIKNAENCVWAKNELKKWGILSE